MWGQKFHGTITTSRTNLSLDERMDLWFRAIEDHVRTLAFAIADGILPSNNGRGHVLRRTLRRAVMFGTLLKRPHAFFVQIVGGGHRQNGILFGKSVEPTSTIETVLKNEEQSFSKTIDRGVTNFHEICEKSGNCIAESDAFSLSNIDGFLRISTGLDTTNGGRTRNLSFP
jgi:alanyl-tRNA synthetase